MQICKGSSLIILFNHGATNEKKPMRLFLALKPNRTVKIAGWAQTDAFSCDQQIHIKMRASFISRRTKSETHLYTFCLALNVDPVYIYYVWCGVCAWIPAFRLAVSISIYWIHQWIKVLVYYSKCIFTSRHERMNPSKAYLYLGYLIAIILSSKHKGQNYVIRL